MNILYLLKSHCLILKDEIKSHFMQYANYLHIKQ